MTPEHDKEILASYSLGLLDGDDRTDVESHVATCAPCGLEVVELDALREILGEVPPEAFLDGPPEDADLLLQRTLRAVRGRRDSQQRGHKWVIGTAAAGVAVLTLIGGVALGRSGAGSATSVADGAQATRAVLPAGAVRLDGTNPTTGVRMTATVLPQPGWVAVDAHFFGVRPGEPCKLIVRSKQGDQEVALSWIAPKNQPATGVALDGAAVVAPADIESIDVVTFSGQNLVSVPI